MLQPQPPSSLSMPSEALAPPLASALVLPPVAKKLPAFGRNLLQARRQGQHPQLVIMVFADNWSGVPQPKLALRPLEFVAGVTDWRVVAGVRVVVLDREAAIDDFDLAAAHYGPIYALVAELVDALAYVELRLPRGAAFTLDSGAAWQDVPADSVAFRCRHRFGGANKGWPAWWSDRRAALQNAAFSRYLDDMERVIRRKTASGEPR